VTLSLSNLKRRSGKRQGVSKTNLAMEEEKQHKDIDPTKTIQS